MLIQIVTNINNKLSLVWETHDLLLRIYYLSISQYVLNNIDHPLGPLPRGKLMRRPFS